MTYGKLKSMVATTALLGLVGPAAAMKTAGSKSAPKPPAQQPPSASRAAPPASRDDQLGALRRSTSAPLGDKKAPAAAKAGQKQGDATKGAEASQQPQQPQTTASAKSAGGRSPLIEALQSEGETKKAESATAEHSDKADQKSDGSEGAKEYEPPDFSQWKAKNAAKKAGGRAESAAATAAPRAPRSVAVKASTLATAKENLPAAGGRKSFEAMIEGLNEDSLRRGRKQGGTARQLRLDIQNISQDVENADFINFQIQVNGGKLPNKEHTSLANVILDKHLLANAPMALEKLKEGLAQSFKEEAKVIVTFNDAEGEQFIKQHDSTMKSSAPDAVEGKKDRKDTQSKS